MIISLVNQKGGVAKTTSTFNIATSLAKEGKNVLMLDLDPQASLTIYTNLEPYELDYSIVDVMRNPKMEVEKSIVKLRERLHIIPSRIELAGLESELLSRTARELILTKALASVRDNYDYIIIDCPPQLSTLTINALACTDQVIIPCKTDFLAYRGIDQLLETVESIKEYFKPDINVLGVLATMFESRANDDKDVLELLKEEYEVIGVVKRTVQSKKGMYDGKSALEVDPDSEFAKEYKRISSMILELK